MSHRTKMQWLRHIIHVQFCIFQAMTINRVFGFMLLMLSRLGLLEKAGHRLLSQAGLDNASSRDESNIIFAGRNGISKHACTFNAPWSSVRAATCTATNFCGYCNNQAKKTYWYIHTVPISTALIKIFFVHKCIIPPELDGVSTNGFGRLLRIPQ